MKVVDEIGGPKSDLPTYRRKSSLLSVSRCPSSLSPARLTVGHSGSPGIPWAAGVCRD